MPVVVVSSARLASRRCCAPSSGLVGAVGLGEFEEGTLLAEHAVGAPARPFRSAGAAAAAPGASLPASTCAFAGNVGFTPVVRHERRQRYGHVDLGEQCQEGRALRRLDVHHHADGAVGQLAHGAARAGDRHRRGHHRPRLACLSSASEQVRPW